MSQHFKLKPIALDTIPKELKPIFTSMLRDLNAAIVTANITPDQLRTTFDVWDEWITEQRNSLPETSAAAG
jgi:hypothetical protein